jgi:Spy/CpxP family protein refolding chaperone
MKKIVMLVMAAVTFILAANAQETRKIKHHKHPHAKAMMMKGMNFTTAQKEQIKVNRDNTKKQLMELNKNDGITVKEYRIRKAAIQQSQKEQMGKLLTTEQKSQLAHNKKDLLAKHELKANKKLDKMKADLNLSDEQLNTMKANREASHAKATTIKENSQLSHAEKKGQLMVLRESQKNNLQQVLTPEQLSKMEEMKKNRMDKTRRK